MEAELRAILDNANVEHYERALAQLQDLFAVHSTDSYIDGAKDGFHDGYEDGREVGFSEGYDDGFSEATRCAIRAMDARISRNPIDFG